MRRLTRFTKTLPVATFRSVKVLFAKYVMTGLLYVFNRIRDLVPEGAPIICESASPA